MKILHLDIETAPHKVYAWGLYDQDISINQIVEPGYTLCWAAKWHGSKGVMFDSLRDSKKQDMVKRIHALMSEADAIVHYNGLKFDIPTLNQEFLQLKLTPPPPTAQIDLYLTARSRFRFASNKLDYVAHTLELGRKIHHKGMDLWSGCMAGNKSDWAVMERYNKQDVKLLEKVYLTLRPWIKNHPNHGNFAGKEGVCPNCGSRNLKSNGYRFVGVSRYRRLQCFDCGAWAKGLAEPHAKNDGSRIHPLRQA